MTNPGRKQSLLARIPKTGRNCIAYIMESRDGALDLMSFLAKRWEREQVAMWLGLSAQELARAEEQRCDYIANMHPEWSRERLRALQPFLFYLTVDLQEAVTARRFVLEEPAELARGLAVLSRLRWIEMCILGSRHADLDWLLEAFAARDVEAVQQLASTDPVDFVDCAEFLDLCTWAIHAACRRDFDRLRDAISQMGVRKHPWQEGVRLCLEAIATGTAAQFAQGLTQYIDATRAMRSKTDLEHAITLRAHGLYRLCEWISPKLVSAVDIAQALPWDAGFHIWTEAHPDPLAGFDLTSISPALHAAVVQLRFPEV